MKIKFIGLMGVGSDNMLYTPSGKQLCKVPQFLARIIQRSQHWIAKKTWSC